MKIRKKNSKRIWTQTAKNIKDDCIRFAAGKSYYLAICYDYFKQQIKAGDIIVL